MFQFKQFTIHQDRCAMKVTTDACLFGAMVAGAFQETELNVLDIGTGTGLLSLMFAQKNPGAVIDAIEMDIDATGQAKENVMASPWKDRINIIHSDAKTFPFSNKYDLIISNPPFYENELPSPHSLKNKARHHEGLLLNELLLVIRKKLKPKGIFCLLLPFKRSEEIKKMFSGNELAILQITFVRQSVHHNYFRIVLKGIMQAKEPVETIFNEISIWNEKQQYTPEFTELLKDYYLHL